MGWPLRASLRALKVITIAAVRQAVYEQHFLLVALLQHLYLAPFPRYSHFSRVRDYTCDLEKSFTFDSEAYIINQVHLCVVLQHTLKLYC